MISAPPSFSVLPHNPAGFVLRREGQDWAKVFATVEEAIAHARTVPDREGALLRIHNQTGRVETTVFL